jgi:hypothetical protein
MKKKFSIIILLFTLFFLNAQEKLTMEFSAEAGFTGIISHVIQTGTVNNKGDLFNYKTQGNQDILFPYNRYQADFRILEKHHAILLYQPLTIETKAPIESSFTYDGEDYDPADGFLNLIYGFDFWRLSYLYELISPPEYFLSVGASLQIRNASIVFKSSENQEGTVTDNIGPVPILKLKTGYQWDSGFFVTFEGDGFYASNEIFNGASYPFTGYIYDLSLRGGYRFREDISIYGNTRFLGGGGNGTNKSGQYTYNDLHSFSVTLGAVYHL